MLVQEHDLPVFGVLTATIVMLFVVYMRLRALEHLCVKLLRTTKSEAAKKRPFSKVLDVLIAEQGEWYVEKILSEKLADVLLFNTRPVRGASSADGNDSDADDIDADGSDDEDIDDEDIDADDSDADGDSDDDSDADDIDDDDSDDDDSDADDIDDDDSDADDIDDDDSDADDIDDDDYIDDAPDADSDAEK